MKAGAAGARLFLCAQGRARAREQGRGGLAAILLLAVLAGLAYSAFGAFQVYQALDAGRGELVAAQAGLSQGARAPDPGSLPAISAKLQRAEQDFEAARRRVREDPALTLIARVAPANAQVQATAHLAAIGADLSRAGESAATIAEQADQLKQRYAGKTLTPDDLPALLKQTEAIATDYALSARAIDDQLSAAHAERAQVATTELLPPLRDAYRQVDSALLSAGTAFRQYQDVRRLLADLLGVSLS
ncbi:MAG: hypothetical protein M3Z11_06410 [Candidatus Dormibacteraeota bacterium]|nr:hypothetical protein [Candidatus Dormibacteraeota bacterium]